MSSIFCMDDDIKNIFEKQANVLPPEVRTFIASADWEGMLDATVEHFTLSEDAADSLRTEVALVLVGLTPFAGLKEALAAALGEVADSVLDAIVAELSVRIFAPIRPALERFFAEQEEWEEEMSTSAPPPPDQPQAQRMWEKMPEVIPDNLPTGQGADEFKEISRENGSEKGEEPLFTPRIIPASPAGQSGESTAGGFHPKTRPSDEFREEEFTRNPFEEKMKKVFTGGIVDRGELAFEQPSSSVNIQQPARSPMDPPFPRAVNDPYREPIE